MGRRLILAGLVAALLSCHLAARAAAERYLNQTKEERPRKKKKVKGFDYENSRYLAQGSDVGSRYVYEEDEAISSGTKPKKARKKKEPEAAAASEDAPASTALADHQPKPAFKKMKSFTEADKGKKGAPAMTPEEALKAGAAAQQQAQQGGGQAGQWQNFGSAPQSSGYGNAGNVKVMP